MQSSSEISGPTCTWCDVPVPEDDGFRLQAAASGERAVFCRLEHVVPWAIKGPRWLEDPETAGPASFPAGTAEPCSYCGSEPEGGRLTLVRHRDEHRILDVFCDVAHLSEWAKAGGRFG